MGNSHLIIDILKLRMGLFKALLIIKVAAFVYTAYLISLLIDWFPWGQSNRDGLYLLFIPILVLPTTFLLTCFEWLVLRKFEISNFIKVVIFIPFPLGLIVVELLDYDIDWLSLALTIGISILLITGLCIVWLNPLKLKELNNQS